MSPRSRRRFAYLGLACAAALLAAVAVAGWVLVSDGPIPVGRETTYLTGPLDADGYVNYLASMRSGEDLPDRLNAARVYAAVSGVEMALPGEADVGVRDFATAAEAARLTPTEWDADAVQERNRQSNACLKSPWTADELPMAAAWLAANGPALDALVEASGRPGYFYRPQKGGPLVTMALPMAQSRRELARLLTARAMNRVALGEWEAAGRDVDALRRMAGHWNEDAVLIELLVGAAVEALAARTELALLARAPDAARVKARQASWAGPAPLDFAACMDRGERFALLGALAEVDRAGRSGTTGAAGFAAFGVTPTWGRRAAARSINVEPLCRRANDYFDRAAAALRMPEAERPAAAAAVDETWRDPLNDGAKSLVWAMAFGEDVSGWVSPLSCTPVLRAWAGVEVRPRLVAVAAAGRLFELAEGRPPASRGDLVPRFLDEWPSDPLDGGPLKDETSGRRWAVFGAVGEFERAEDRAGREVVFGEAAASP